MSHLLHRDERETTCEQIGLHPEAVARANAYLATHPRLEEQARVFAVLGDPVRLRILVALRSGELCVCDLCAVLGMSASAVSHQLRLLRLSRLVRSSKRGRVVCYRLDDEHVTNLLLQAEAHSRHG
jgi:ArsR family transcriptional regulator